MNPHNEAKLSWQIDKYKRGIFIPSYLLGSSQLTNTKPQILDESAIFNEYRDLFLYWPPCLMSNVHHDSQQNICMVDVGNQIIPQSTAFNLEKSSVNCSWTAAAWETERRGSLHFHFCMYSHYSHKLPKLKEKIQFSSHFPTAKQETRRQRKTHLLTTYSKKLPFFKVTNIHFRHLTSTIVSLGHAVYAFPLCTHEHFEEQVRDVRLR